MSPRLGGRSSSRRVSFLPSLPLPLLLLSFLPSLALSSYICNGGTDYTCICDNSTLSSPSSTPPCSHFIESDSLAAVDIRIRHALLEGPGPHKSESYEKYFKRRMANVVSAYCERNANECTGMALVVHPENIVLLRTQREPFNITRILFNVLKGQTIVKGAHLNADNIMDPVKVKYLLGSRPVPLARILGGPQVESVRVGYISGGGGAAHKGGQKDNTKLVWMCTVFGTFFGICYAIGIYRLCMDQKLKREKKRKAAATEATQMIERERECKSANYGSMVTAHPNGGAATVVAIPHHSPSPPSTRALLSPTMGTCYTRPSSSMEACNSLPRTRLSDRQAYLMFGCDPSQLPKEASIDMGMDQMPSTVPPAHTSSSSVSPPLHPNPIPAVVLLSSHSLSRDSPLADPLPSHPSSSIHDTPVLSTHRPKSRRGSRVDDGIETIDFTERTVQPFSPELSEEEMKRSLHKRLTDEAWSSSEGEVDVYYKLSEEEGEGARGDEWPTKGLREGEEDPSSVVIFSPPRKTRPPIHDDSSDEEEREEEEEVRKEEDGVDVRDEDDIHGYERLREEASPLPPPTTQYSIDDDDLR